MTQSTKETDVIVVGSGMAGLVSAVRALENEADVIVLEKGPRPGGKTYLSGGLLITDDDANPTIAPYEPIEKATDWLKEIGVTVKESEETWDAIDDAYAGDLLKIEPPDFVEYMVDLIEEKGGDLWLRSPMERLLVDDQGEITGTIAHRENQGPVEVCAPCVVLATGGFGGGEELVERYITENTENLWLRADPWSTGDGLVAAKNIGAKTTTGLSQFKGHSMIAPPAQFTPDEFMGATQYYGPRAVALNKTGNRFIDESKEILEDQLVQTITKDAGGRAFFVIDKELYDSTWVGGHVGTMVETAKDLGGPVIKADSFETLGDRLADHSVHSQNALETLETFNEAVREEDGMNLTPTRRRFQSPIDSPPFYAISIQPGISYTLGGLDVNKNTEVLSRTRGCSTLSQFTDRAEEVFFEPIRGLYAGGVDVGNSSDGYFFGSLDLALVTGRIAGKHAAERAVQEREI